MVAHLHYLSYVVAMQEPITNIVSINKDFFSALEDLVVVVGGARNKSSMEASVGTICFVNICVGSSRL